MPITLAELAEAVRLGKQTVLGVHRGGGGNWLAPSAHAQITLDECDRLVVLAESF